MNGENKNCQVYQKTAKNTLKLHPQKKTIITTSDLHVLDGTTQYIIKIINRKRKNEQKNVTIDFRNKRT